MGRPEGRGFTSYEVLLRAAVNVLRVYLLSLCADR